MKRPNRQRNTLNDLQRKRMRTVHVTVSVLCCGLLILGLWGMKENAVETTDPREYLLAASAPQEDPLGLAGMGLGFELTGVSQDGSIVGYAADDSVEGATSRLKAALQSRGWVLESDTGLGILTFSGEDAANGSSFGYLVQFSSLGQDCAFVIQRW